MAKYSRLFSAPPPILLQTRVRGPKQTTLKYYPILHPCRELSAYCGHIVRHLRLVPQIPILPTILRQTCATKRPSLSCRRIRQHPSTYSTTFEPHTRRPTTTTPRWPIWPTRPSITPIVRISLPHTIPSSPRRDGPRLSWRSPRFLRR